MQYKELESGIAVPHYIQPQKKRPTAFSFFAGCGGMDLGFMQSGFEVLGANEFDAAASLTYMTNLGSYPINIHYIDGEKDKERLDTACERYLFGKNGKDQSPDNNTPFGIYNLAMGSGLSGSGWIRHYSDVPPVRNFWFGDVRKLKGQDILDALGLQQGDLDCVFGGPPCQGYSRAGKQNIADPRNNLVYEYARMIVELQPKAFLMEEVPDIINFFDPDGVPVLDKFCLLLQEGGFGKWDTLKKSMLMQTGAAAGLKSTRGNESVNRKPVKKIVEPQKPRFEQMNLFE